MWVGSEDCKFDKNATISLTGSQASPTVTDFGNKFLGVGAKGTLELHGAAYTPTWTKLSKTIRPINWKSPNGGRGMNIAAFSPITAELISFNSFDTYANESHSEALATLINGFQKDTIVAVYSADEASRSLTRNAMVALQSLGSSSIQTIQHRSAWACVGIKGAANGTASEEMRTEATRPTPIVTRLVSSSNGKQILISVQSQNWTGFITAEDRSQEVIDLVDAVNWKPGHKIVIASSDLDYTHSEENEIIACPSCTSKQIKLKEPLKYRHWGEFVHGVDERTEVGLLSRNIVIRGLLANGNDKWGAHTKVIGNFTNAHFENVEYFQVGQPILAMYPVHFHMVGDVDQLGGYSSPAYVKGCSVHKSFSRCFTLHGVHGLLVKDNVAYDHVGHCYFVEDGGEMRNQLIGNLGLGTHWGSLILSERSSANCRAELPDVDSSVCHGPATFWLTNPNNTMIGNSAAGSVFMGIWYIFPARPSGPSKNVYPNLQIQYIPMAPFENNMVHSSPIGVMVDDAVELNEASPNYLGVIGGRYRPHERPTLSSPRVPAVIKELTVHHASSRGVWVRGGDYRLDGAYFADNNIGVTLASEGAMPNDPGSSQELKNGIFVGRSANGYDPYGFPVRGFEVYDGPIRCINCSFFEFVPTAVANHSAIGFLLGNNWQLATTSFISQAKFDSKSLRLYGGGNPPVWRDINDGERNTVIKDLDGSISGVRGSSIVNGYPVHTTKMCTYREDWNMSICPHKYGQLFIKNDLPLTTNYNGKFGMYLVRDETSDYKLWMEGIPSGEPRTQFQPMVIMNKTYTIHWEHSPPTSVSIQMTNFDNTDWVRVGVCFPPTSQLAVTYLVGGRRFPLQSVASIEDLNYNPNITTYYWDSAVGMAFVVLRSQYSRVGDEYCGSMGCETVQIVVSGTNTGVTSTAPGYCSGAYPKYAAIEPSPPPTPSDPPSSSTAVSATTAGDQLADASSAASVSMIVVLVLLISLLI